MQWQKVNDQSKKMMKRKNVSITRIFRRWLLTPLLPGGIVVVVVVVVVVEGKGEVGW